MIAVRRGGRLGNQMFQLAFVHAASRRLGTGYVVLEPRRPGRRELGPPLWQFFELEPWRRRAVRARRSVAFQLSLGPRPEVIVEQDQAPEAVLAGLRDGAVYQGFFQSERWFAGFEDEVRHLFTVREEHVRSFARYKRAQPYLCVHVRRTDYLETNAWALPPSFFLDALGAVPDRERYDVVVVSDDPESVRHELGEVPRVVCERRPMIVDLLLLMNADVVITSNSSFSWWGAWLNQRPDVQVIAPQHWFGFARDVEEPTGVIPPRWRTVPVRDGPLLANPREI